MTESQTQIKVAPSSKESEMMVLGCMLTSVNSLNIGADTLDDSDFYFTEHKIIFQILKTAYREDKPADVHLVSEELKRQDKLKAVGGVGYITTLAQYAGTSAYIEEYVNLVKDKSVLRRMISSAQTIEKSALNEPPDVHAALDEAQAMFFKISQSANTSAGVMIGDVLSGVKSTSQEPYLKELQTRQEDFQKRGPEDPGIVGIPTHFMDLDRLLNGLNDSNLIILAARPAMGKTALALNIAESVCIKSSIPVGIFSLEMSADQLVHRIVCSQAEVESEKVKTGSLNGMEFQRVVSAVSELSQHNMLIDDQPGLKITDLRARARRMKESYNVGLIIIDYLQLITGSGSSRNMESRQNEISEISRMLKTLARELNIPVICLSQLSRKVEERHGHRPMMSDLRESGCLTGDTLIKDADSGELYTLRQLAERKEQTPISVYAVDSNLKLGKHKMVKAFYSGRKQVFELKTKSGRSIRASANHPFLQLNGWTRLDELQAGARIGLPREMPLPDKRPHQKDAVATTTGCMGLQGTTTTLRRSNVSQNLIASTLQLVRDPKLRDLATSGVYWDEIASITPLGEEDVYDATVEQVHNFVANDIIVHNSIEQDADQVLFLLRREYYDPLDKPGMAEVIVGKNRHGPVGSVHLTFLKEYTRFANYSPVKPDVPTLEEEETVDAAFDPFSAN